MNEVFMKLVISSNMNEFWQANKTLQESHLYMLENAVESDITFRVGEDEEAVHAHKLIMASRSSVFMAMFHGALQEVEQEIKLPDTDPASFKTFLRYIYADELKLTVHNCMSLLYLAKKYIINNLERNINTFVISILPEIEAVHVIGIFNDIISLDGSQLIITECVCRLDNIIMKKNASKDELNQLCQEALLQFTKSVLLLSPEETIFDTCLQWARNKCLEENLKKIGKNLRKVLGEILFEIRFPLYNLLAFTKEVSGLGILTEKECNDLFRLLTLKNEESEVDTVRKIEQKLVFKNTKRRYIKVVVMNEINLSGQRFTKEVDLDKNVSSLLDLVKEELGLKEANLYLKYKNKTLQPGVKLMDYGVNNGETITFMFKLISQKD